MMEIPMTTAPKQRDLLTGRWRMVAEFEPSELQLQISLVEWCRWRLRPDVIFWHTPNGEARDKRTAAKLKAMGVLPGVADLQFMWREQVLADLAPSAILTDERFRLRVLFLELKRKGGKQTETQDDFERAVSSTGAHYRCIDSIDDAMAVIERYGLTK
jgi:hypothetical protein